MVINIRNIDKDIVFRIDKMANAQNKSRNQFLKEQISLFATHSDLLALENKYEKLLNITLKAIDENTEVLAKLSKELDI